MPNGRINAGNLNIDATASIGLITASFIGADTIEVSEIVRRSGSIDPCCVYVTGSSTNASNRLRSIQPKNSFHFNNGIYSVINGGNCHEIDANTQFGGIQSGFSSSLSQQYGSNIAGGVRNKIKEGTKGLVSASAILGGANNVIDGSEFSAILGGSLNCIVNHSHSFVLGHSIEATASCTTFTNCLNIQTIDQAVPGDHLLTRHTESGLVRQGPSISQVEGDVFFTNTLLNPNVDVYRTGSGPTDAIRSSSIQPYFTAHDNRGHLSVIGGGDNHCIFDSAFDAGTPFHNGIFSGKDNSILDVSSTFIGGGFKNCVNSPSSGSVVGGGVCNQIEGDFTSGNESSIVGGRGNCLKNTTRAFIGGGQDNTISSSLEASIVGGDSNTLRTAGFSSIAGGQGNCIVDVANAGFIGGGIENQITSNTSSSFDTIVNGNCNEITLDLNKGAVGSNTIIGGNNNTIKISALTGSLIPDGFNQIGGGECNTITGSVEHSTIVGGHFNTINHNVILNCRNRTFITSGSSIVGGCNNQISNSPLAFIGGGDGNSIGKCENPLNSDHCNAAIVAGQDNKISSRNSENSIIGAGKSNDMNGGAVQFIGAGIQNYMWHGIANAIVAGCKNTICSYNDYNFIGAGSYNKVATNLGIVVGGEKNCVISMFGFVGGGRMNKVTGASGCFSCEAGRAWFSFIGGGVYNDVRGRFSSIVGGRENQTFHTVASIIGGGDRNCIRHSDCSSILAGFCNHISGSSDNFSNSACRVTFSSIIGGSGNTIGHDHTFIVGSNLTSSRACTTFINSADISGSVDLNLSQIPTSDVGLRQGQLYRTGSAFDEIRIKL